MYQISLMLLDFHGQRRCPVDANGHSPRMVAAVPRQSVPAQVEGAPATKRALELQILKGLPEIDAPDACPVICSLIPGHDISRLIPGLPIKGGKYPNGIIRFVIRHHEE